MTRNGSDQREKDLFERAMRGVEPLSGVASGPAPRRRRPGSAAKVPSEGAGVEFRIERWGEHIEGLAAGVPEERLYDLRNGSFEPELTLNLRGMGEEEARHEVRALLRRASKAGVSAVLIVHGRGRRSPHEPVLKTRLPGWLSQPPYGRCVLAFSSAGPHGRGGGATAVLLQQPPSARGWRRPG